MSILSRSLLNICTKYLLPDQPCVLCTRMSPGLWCAACDCALPYLGAEHCPICAQPSPAGAVCGKCLKHPPRYARTTAVFVYAYPVDRLIQALKYGEQLALARPFAQKLAQRIGPLPDYVIPMPLHPARLRERGFNQALLLARNVARELNLKLLPDACQRVRDTPPQSSLPWLERKKNLRDAFCCDVDLSGKHIALVDDVLTTGASLNALAKAVQARGASEISAWVLARTLPKERQIRDSGSTLKLYQGQDSP